MRPASWGIAVLGLVAGLSPSGRAEACGATPPPFYVVANQAPTSADTPLNAPLIVLLREDPTIPEAPTLAPRVTLTKQGADEALTLRAVSSGPEQVWVPVEALEPETTYEASFNPGYEGVPDTSWTFTTGTAATPALSLEGELAASLEQGTQMIQQCPPNACPCGCSEADLAALCTTVEAPVLSARVTLPRARNGFAGRTGTVFVTDTKPRDLLPPSKTGPQPYTGENVSISQYVDLEGADAAELLIPLPQQDVAYRPCFAFSARDARGDEATVQSLCLDELVPALASETDDPEQPGADGFGDDQQKPAGTSEGCSISGAPSGSPWLALLGLFAIARHRRAPRA